MERLWGAMKCDPLGRHARVTVPTEVEGLHARTKHALAIKRACAASRTTASSPTPEEPR